jgi:hypothetical protein
MTHHRIKNQNGKFIYDRKHYEAIKNMLHNGRDECFIEGKRITVKSDFRKDGDRETVVNIEGISDERD